MRKTSGCVICIDLKSFYASVECADRGLDPFTTNLVVADPDRSANTICLAITPAMKAAGVRNRCRVRDIPPGIEYLTAIPRMKRYCRSAAKSWAATLSLSAHRTCRRIPSTSLYGLKIRSFWQQTELTLAMYLDNSRQYNDAPYLRYRFDSRLCNCFFFH